MRLQKTHGVGTDSVGCNQCAGHRQINNRTSPLTTTSPQPTNAHLEAYASAEADRSAKLGQSNHPVYSQAQLSSKLEHRALASTISQIVGGTLLIVEFDVPGVSVVDGLCQYNVGSIHSYEPVMSRMVDDD